MTLPPQDFRTLSRTLCALYCDALQRGEREAAALYAEHYVRLWVSHAGSSIRAGSREQTRAEVKRMMQVTGEQG